MLNIILSGAPGSGKGTQSDLLVKHYGLQHLSTGDVLRKEIKTGSELGKQIDALISKGNLVSDDMMYGVIDHYLANLPKDSKGIILDGYPRTVAQAESLTELLQKYKMEAIMIDMMVDEQLLISIPSDIVSLSITIKPNPLPTTICTTATILPSMATIP